MARATITNYFKPVPRHSQETTSASNTATSVSVPDTSTTQLAGVSTQITQPTSSNDNIARDGSGDSEGPPRKKLKLTADNGRELALRISQTEKTRNLKRVKTEEHDKSEVSTRVKEGALSNKSKSRAKLRVFPEFPVDVIFEVFSHLMPLDLLHLMRTNKDLRRLLRDRSSTYVWKSAFENVNIPPVVQESDTPTKFRKLPPCPDDLQLPQWASFIWDTFCQVRLRSLIRGSLALLLKGLPSRIVQRVTFATSIFICESDTATSARSNCCALEMKFMWSDRNSCTVEAKDAFLQEFKHLKKQAGLTALLQKDESLEVIPKEVEQFVAKKEADLQVHTRHANKCRKWYDLQVQEREDALDKIKLDRVNFIRTKLAEEGYTAEIQFLDNLDKRICAVLPWPNVKTFSLAGWNRYNQHPLLKIVKPLNDQTYAKIEPELIKWMQSISKLVVQNEVNLRVQEREALFHQAYLEWRNDPATLKAYHSSVLMPSFADVLGLELGGFGDDQEEHEADDEAGGWEPLDPYNDPNDDREDGGERLGKVLSRGLRIVRESADEWHRTRVWWGMRDKQPKNVWDVFDEEEEEEMKKKIEADSEHDEDRPSRKTSHTNQLNKRGRDVEPREVTLDLAKRIINAKVPYFVDKWRRAKTRDLWIRAYSRRDLNVDDPDWVGMFGTYPTPSTESFIRFPWWDENGKSAPTRSESEKNSYNTYNEEKKERLRKKDLQLAVVVFRCHWQGGTCHYDVERRRCCDQGICNNDGMTPQGTYWDDVKDNEEPCLWYPEFLHHPCQSITRTEYYEQQTKKHATFYRGKEYSSSIRSTAWEGFELKHRSRKTNPRALKFDEKASRVVKALLLAAMMDEEETTVRDMDQFDGRFVCLKCSFGHGCDGQRRMRVFTWRDAVQHALRAHFGDARVTWECLSWAETARAIALEQVEKVKKGYLPENRQKLWRCLKCRGTKEDPGRMTLREMRRHWIRVADHGDHESISASEETVNHPERPSLPEYLLGYYRALDCVSRELPPVKMIPQPMSEEEKQEMEAIKQKKMKAKEKRRRKKDPLGSFMRRVFRFNESDTSDGDGDDDDDDCY
ncbi:hypothetical protein CPC08DRAFT_729929 [Agrocybe pediades]|nr:hypothetical protein CPC08DRAFT_729929 [Agrocybe pediades]